MESHETRPKLWPTPSYRSAIAVIENCAMVSACQAATPRELKIASALWPVE
jgi:CO dehydrogenase/acetyl-CoA synthase alpha subunit